MVAVVIDLNRIVRNDLTERWYLKKYLRVWICKTKWCLPSLPLPQKCQHILILRTCKYVTLMAKRTLWMWLRLPTFRWGDYPGRTNLITWVIKTCLFLLGERMILHGRCNIMEYLMVEEGSHKPMHGKARKSILNLSLQRKKSTQGDWL
jgi:hypothetical protein